MVRAVLGWSQTELGRRVGLTQRAIHKLERGETVPRRTTVRAIEAIWREQDIGFENLADGGFRVNIGTSALDRSAMTESQRPSARRHSRIRSADRSRDNRS
jgi:DNA-binding XRE family transcriptional regulator